MLTCETAPPRIGDAETGGAQGGPGTSGALRPSRRALTRGLAWTAPVALASIAAPAFAVSSECTPVTNSSTMLSYGSPGNGNAPANSWTQPTPSPSTQMAAGNVRFQSSWTPAAPGATLSNAAVQTDDPSGIQQTTTDLVRVICLRAGTYTFAAGWSAFRTNHRPVTLTMNLLDAETGAQIPQSTTAVAEAPMSTTHFTGGNLSITATLAQRRLVRFRYRWTFPAVTQTQWNTDTAGFLQPTRYGWRYANDIAVQAPTVTFTT